MSGDTSDNRIKTAGVHDARRFSLKPDAGARAALADAFGILGIKKLTFEGEAAPSGARDLTLRGQLGATVVQACVVTGDPVTTRIDEPVLRHFIADLPEPADGETEMPEDENADPLPEILDLSEVMAEALALSLPPWPRSEGVDPVEISVTEPGKTPMTDDDAKPFAALKNLAKRMDSGDD